MGRQLREQEGTGPILRFLRTAKVSVVPFEVPSEARMALRADPFRIQRPRLLHC